jgi:O-methyltransferase involved in polyketide biosynthesis
VQTDKEEDMSEIPEQTLSGVAETLLMTLYIRAMESQRPDALIKDEKAVALVEKLNIDSSWQTTPRIPGINTDSRRLLPIFSVESVTSVALFVLETSWRA